MNYFKENPALKVGGVLLFVMVIAIVYTYMTATPSDPTGYRGTSWGSAPEVLPHGQLIESNGDLSYYRRTDEDPHFRGIPVTGVIYGYYKGKLYAVYVYFDAREHFQKIKESLVRDHGEPTKIDQGDEKFFWNGETVNLLLTRTDNGQKGRLTYSYNTLQTEVELSSK